MAYSAQSMASWAVMMDNLANTYGPQFADAPPAVMKAYRALIMSTGALRMAADSEARNTGAGA